MNTNPMRLIATCEICLTNGSTRVASVGHDLAYDMSAAAIHSAITDEVYSSLTERNYDIASVVVTSICNLGQVPIPAPSPLKVEVVTPVIPKYTDRYISPDRCVVCSDPIGHGGLPCPRMAAYS